VATKGGTLIGRSEPLCAHGLAANSKLLVYGDLSPKRMKYPAEGRAISLYTMGKGFSWRAVFRSIKTFSFYGTVKVADAGRAGIGANWDFYGCESGDAFVVFWEL